MYWEQGSDDRGEDDQWYHQAVVDRAMQADAEAVQIVARNELWHLTCT